MARNGRESLKNHGFEGPGKEPWLEVVQRTMAPMKATKNHGSKATKNHGSKATKNHGSKATKNHGSKATKTMAQEHVFKEPWLSFSTQEPWLSEVSAAAVFSIARSLI
ncbi:hypothetical protein CDAR_52121 [Caerostris darwini]|uniref:Uncharacterized protein n=1 Tax=Caerostris darwini TaxID=1538125 RepID=A0AAV4NL79_9ARAC|nr:hypothetical protein CDAR_52121 [Caerostris darwini]